MDDIETEQKTLNTKSSENILSPKTDNQPNNDEQNLNEIKVNTDKIEELKINKDECLISTLPKKEDELIKKITDEDLEELTRNLIAAKTAAELLYYYDFIDQLNNQLEKKNDTTDKPNLKGFGLSILLFISFIMIIIAISLLT